MAECISCIKDRKTGICRDIKDKTARENLAEITEKLNETIDTVNSITGVDGGNLATDQDIAELREEINTAVGNIDLSEYVKKTDYATTEKEGVIKVGAGLESVNNTLHIQYAKESQIEAKSGYRNPLAPQFIDLITKVGLTTNTLEWTDEEKTNATNLLGAVKQVEYSKTQTITDGSDGGVIGRAYIRFRDNTENSIVLHAQNVKYTVPYRDAAGNFYVGTPTQDYHTANKMYVDDMKSGIEAQIDSKATCYKGEGVPSYHFTLNGGDENVAIGDLYFDTTNRIFYYCNNFTISTSGDGLTPQWVKITTENDTNNLQSQIDVNISLNFTSSSNNHSNSLYPYNIAPVSLFPYKSEEVLDTPLRTLLDEQIIDSRRLSASITVGGSSYSAVLYKTHNKYFVFDIENLLYLISDSGNGWTLITRNNITESLTVTINEIYL